MKEKIALIALFTIALAGCGHDAPPVNEPDVKLVSPTSVVTVSDSTVLEEPEKFEEKPDEEPEKNSPASLRNIKDSTDPVGILSYLGKGENFIYSPESFKTAMYMYGMMLPDSDEKDDIDTLTAGRDYLKYKNSSTLKLVNRIWIDSEKKYDFTAYPELLNLAYALPMSDPDSTGVKDAYVAEQTENFIESTPTKFTPDVVMDVMNITYFHAVWDKEFNDIEVLPDKVEFKDYDGNTQKIEMIGFYDERRYIESDDAYAVRLFYSAEDEETANSMYVILPKEGKKTEDIRLADFIDDGENKVNWQRAYVDFKMPRIDLNCTWTMDPYDNDLTGLFGLDHFGTAGFDPAIYAQPGGVPALSQVVRIKSDEEGTTAAAVTEILVENCAIDIDPLPTINLTCDRPFVYVIYDETNRDIAFIGQYMYPER